MIILTYNRCKKLMGYFTFFFHMKASKPGVYFTLRVHLNLWAKF